jgi:hypothetical protein
MKRVKCYFCDQMNEHSQICIANDKVSRKHYIEGFRSGLQPDPAIRSSHPMFLKGWCRGLRLVNNPNTRIKKKPP